MNILVWGDDEFYNELRTTCPDADWQKISANKEFLNGGDFSAAFVSGFDDSFILPTHGIPVFINAVNDTLAELNAPANACRINGWPGMLQRNVWELAGASASHLSIVNDLGKKAINQPDVPGFVSANVIAMIINEAYHAIDDKVSTEDEIDIAMKLGTNYPFGPIEWSRKIGIKNISSLLKKLSQENLKYKPAKGLEILYEQLR